MRLQSIALKYPLAGLGICIGCLNVHLRAEPPGAAKPISQA